MLRNRHTIGYLDDAVVFDEKVQKEETFSNQRRRWLSAQVKYLREDFFPSLRALLTGGNLDYFDKVIQFIQPPRILLLGAVLLFGTLFFIVNLFMDAPVMLNLFWLGVGSFCFLAFVCSVPRSFSNRRTLKALATIPHGMFLMLGSLLKIRGADKEFLHTKHGVVDFNE
jgi:cellulose synthase/poly-beta-1,6-N-acetylglucosamine synthase-like glycosyltransferase